MKVALFLEEAGLPYEAIPVDTRKGEQHLPAFTAADLAFSNLLLNLPLLHLKEKKMKYQASSSPA